MVLIEEIDLRKEANGEDGGSRYPEYITPELKTTIMAQEIKKLEERRAAEDKEMRKGYAIILSFALFTIHCTLSAVALTQYAQEVHYWPIIKSSAPTIPLFMLLVYAFHPFKSVFLVLAIAGATVCGCYLVQLVETGNYLTVITRTPAISTVWIWLFIEIEWYWGLLSVIVTVSYAKFYGLPLY